jgi:hypothetical protein
MQYVGKSYEFQVNSWVVEDVLAHQEYKAIFGYKSPMFMATGQHIDN